QLWCPAPESCSGVLLRCPAPVLRVGGVVPPRWVLVPSARPGVSWDGGVWGGGRGCWGGARRGVVEPVDGGAEDGSGAVGEGEFVVAGGQAALLLHVAVAAFDDVAAAVGLHVEAHGASAA